MNSTNENELFGVWLKGKGWLKKDNDPSKTFADYSRKKVEQVARIFRGEVRHIDKSLIDLEKEIIEAERISTWDTLLKLFKHKINT